MSLNTSLKGRLRNTNLPKTNVLFPLFEAVVNSIHAIDERIEKQQDFSIDQSKIRIEILRSAQLQTDSSVRSEIVGFKVTDNGIGFNEDNYNSFQTLDSDYKIALGGKGVGRLFWLKAFNKVQVESIFLDKSNIMFRHFYFNVANDIYDHKCKLIENEEIQTTILLNDLKIEYEKYLPKTCKKISHTLLEHCLWYFLREGGAPNIQVADETEVISLNNEYENYMLGASSSEKISIKTRDFELTHIKLRTTSPNKHTVIYCAANRVVKEESLVGKIPGLFGVLKNGNDTFSYSCFVTSDYLTEKVNLERIDFNISENVDGIFSEEEVSLSEIREAVIERSSIYLDDFLEENREIGKRKMFDFVEQKAPRYRPILDRIPENEKIIDPSLNDKELELKLHAHLMSIEAELLSEGHELLIPTDFENEEEYSNRIQDYLIKASDIKKSDLANYVAHRRVILDLLGKAIKIKEDGKYSKEEVIHNLIMPMKKTSDELFADETNLWLIDERLAFHNFLASDKTLKSMPITDSELTKEPDLIALNIYDNPLLVNDSATLPLASITVVEIKRPMRDDLKQGEEKDPIEQALGYLKKIRDGRVNTASGRLIPNSEAIPGYCYVIADITDSLKTRCETKSLQVTSDKMGYFGYNQPYNAYIEVVSFDRLINMAKERNKAFFDKLGLPTK